MTSSHLSQKQLDRFKGLLDEKRQRLIDQARETLSNEMILSPDDRFDEVDQASSEYMQAFSFRLRGRERFLMSKIEIALRKMEEGTFGICEECEEPISNKRLEARPEAPLCIQCKEAQEKEEAVYAD
jgi:DnaK suppressor protein